MERTPRPRVKICCIASEQEAQLAVRAGAAALGLVSVMPSGPGVIDDAAIARIAARVPPPVATFLLTSRTEAEPIIAQQRQAGCSTLQLVDRVAPGTHASLRAALPGIRLVQVVHVTGPESLDEAVALSKRVDAILLDSGDPSLAVKALGGTGRRHDWGVSRAIREAIEVPLFLAGGLNASNVREAVESVGPFGLDVCSGVRSEGRLDPGRLEAFFAALP